MGASYTAALAVTGGTPPYANWSVFAGPLPPGLALNSSTGLISGIPAASGMYGFWVNVSDSAGNVSAPQNFMVTIAPPPSIAAAALPSGLVNTAYSAALVVSGGTTPYANWAVTAGNLPPGLMLNSAGVISGNPTNNGFYTFSVTVQDADGVTSNAQTFSIVIGLTITTTSLPNWTLGAPYSVQLNASGGTPPYGGWTVASATLPPGLTLDPVSGLLGGIPSATGGYSFTITVGDAAAATAAPQPFTISIAVAPVVGTTSLPSGVVSVPYSATLAISGGTAPVTWSIPSGTLPTGLTLFSTTGIISGIPKSAAVSPFRFKVQATDAAGVTAIQQLSIAINQASLMVSPGSLTFNVNPAVPGSLAAQSISVFSNSGPVAFSASSTSSGGNWLSVSGGGTTPGSLSVSVSTGGLATNTPYSGQITITGPTLPKAVTVPVTLNVAMSLPSHLLVVPGSLTLDYAQGFAVDQRYFLATNTGSGTIAYTVNAQTESCGGWLNLLSSSGQASASSPGLVAVQVSPAGLSGQTCAGTITVSGGAQTQTIPVTMTVSALPQSVLLSRTAVLFQSSYGGAAPPAQTFSVLNAGAGSIDWTIVSQTMSGGNWLTANPASGSSATGIVPVPVTLSVDPNGLAPGDYYGSVQVTAPGAGNGPQSVTVILTVSAQTPAQLTPAGVILVGQTATGTSEIETLTLTNLGGNPLSFTSTTVTDNHGSWLVQKPASGTVAAGGVSTMTLQANVTGLAAGTQHGVARVAFADGAIHTVDVYLIVPGVGNTPGCFTNGFVAVFQSPEQGFQAIAQTPVPLQVLAKDCNTGKVVKRSNGLSTQVLIGPLNSTAVALTDDGAGTWTGTWTPATAASPMNLTALVDSFANGTASVVSGQATVSGTVNAATTAAAGVVTSIVNGVSDRYPSLVTPGSPVSLRGAGMAGETASVAGPPFPTSLGGTQVLLQGQPLPLSYVDAKQVDAVIPAGVTANERQQLLVVRDNTISAGVNVQVASPQAGFMTKQ